ncbi:MAG: alginate lyase family protein [Rubrimonas sp.]
MKRLLAFAALLPIAACSGIESLNERAIRTTAAETFTRTDVPGASVLFSPLDASTAARTPHVRGRRHGARFCVGSDRGDEAVATMRALAPDSIVAMQPRPGSSAVPRDFSRALNLAAASVILDNDLDRAEAAVAALRRHAEAGAWVSPTPNWSMASATIEALPPALTAWQILRQTAAASDEDRAAIDAWLASVSAVGDVHPAANHVGSIRAANRLMLGGMLGDQNMIDAGVADWRNQIDAIAADGSFPLEADRGRNALIHTARNIAFLIHGAEIAASMGVDLYGYRSKSGRSLDDAIAFMLDADEDNALIDVHARANRRPGSDAPDFRPGAQNSPWNGAYSGTALYYLNRFPDKPTARKLREKVAMWSRLSADATGGMMSCWVGFDRP